MGKQNLIIKLFFFIFFSLLISCHNDDSLCHELKHSFKKDLLRLKTKEDSILLMNKVEKTIIKNGRCSFAYHVRGWLRIQKADFIGAKLDFLTLLGFGDSSVYSLFNLSRLYNLESSNDSALYYIKKAIDKKRIGNYALDRNFYTQDEFDIHYNSLIMHKAIVEAEIGMFKSAKRDFIYIYNQNIDESGEASSFLSTIYFYDKKYDSACFFLDQSYKRGYFEILDSAVLKRCK